MSTETMYDAFALALRHPVTLLILTAILTGILVPRVTRIWQDRAKQLEIKIQLVEAIALATETYFSRLQLLELKGTAAAVSLDDALGDWRTTYAIIEAKLEAYFPKNVELHQQWQQIGAALWTTYFLLRNETPAARLGIWNGNKQVFSSDPGNFMTLIDTPIGNVGDRLASYDLELQMLLDRFRFKRLDLLNGLLQGNLALR